MARPLLNEYAGALSRVTTRGDRQEAMFEDGTDRLKFLAISGKVVEQMQ